MLDTRYWMLDTGCWTKQVSAHLQTSPFAHPHIRTSANLHICIHCFPIFAAMIAFLKGDFVHKSPSAVHIDVNGVGYEVQISLNTFTRIQQLDKGSLHIV